MSNEIMYLIESMEHTHDDTIMWWKPNSLGYTCDVEKAGRYSKTEAEKIVEGANYCKKKGEENERMWPEVSVYNGIAGYISRTVQKY